MRVRILGCGTSTGVPKIGNHWGQCDPNEPRNYRLRSSIMVESGGARAVIDCGPDLRQQLLGAQVERLDAVIVTHDHGDHVHGIDELRPVSQAIGRPVPLLGRAETLMSLRARFEYAFARSDAPAVSTARSSSECPTSRAAAKSSASTRAECRWRPTSTSMSSPAAPTASSAPTWPH